jgi:hypothetical protein
VEFLFNVKYHTWAIYTKYYQQSLNNVLWGKATYKILTEDKIMLFKKTTIMILFLVIISNSFLLYTVSVQARPATPCADFYAAALDAGVNPALAWGGFCACLDRTYGGDNSDCWGAGA